jgi:bis(5'-nucleosyl)-tetraphosphatase (symmetrical)
MSVYWVGDLQGCDEPLGRLLDEVGFSPSRDRLFVLGDLVNRGPSSLAVLKRLSKMGNSIECVLGNHDMHLLALAAGARQPSRTDTLTEILEAPDRHALLNWLQHQSLALYKEDVLMVHAGVLPQWTLQTTLELASEIEAVLRGPDATEFFMNMYGNEPAQWAPDLKGWDRLRCALNAFTRLRFCATSGQMEFKVKENSAQAPEGYMPWFEVPARQTAGTRIAFGHWSTLGAVSRADIWAMDTGCVWGGCLTALQRDTVDATPRSIEIKCPPYQTPF